MWFRQKVWTNIKAHPIAVKIYRSYVQFCQYNQIEEPKYEELTARGIPGGLHAEMAIVRYFIEAGYVDPYELVPEHDPDPMELVVVTAKDVVAALRGNLVVACLGKPVCPDCGGWMNAHGIGHFSVVATGDSRPRPRLRFEIECGKASMNWTHPRTAMRFEGAADKLKRYQHQILQRIN